MRGAGPAAAMGRSAACTLGGGPLWDTPPQHGPPSPELWRLSPGLDRPAVRGGVSQGDCAQRIAGDSIPRCANARAFHDFGPDLRRARAPQPASAIGAELLAVAVVSGAALLILDRHAGHAREPGTARYGERFSPNTITAVLVAVAGVTVIARAGGGLFWLIPAVAASLIRGVVNAWQFLVRVPS